MAKGKAGIVTKESRKRSILKKKPVKLPSVVNGVKISDIPETINERRKFLLERLNRYKGKKIFCPALNDNVYVTKASIDEMVHRAGRYTNATIVALNLKTIIKNASYLKRNVAKDNRRQKELRLKEMITLICPIKKYGLAKLTIGKRYSGRLIQYCVTVIKIEWLKEE